MEATSEQKRVLNSDKKKLIISASAGSGKTWVMVEYIKNLIVKQRVPIKRLLVLTFTKAGAGEIRERINKALLSEKSDKFILEQIDDLTIADVSTIDSFCEKLIRKNIDKLSIDEGFRLVENPLEYKYKAFEKALLSLDETDLIEIEMSYRRNKDSIFKIICAIEDFLLVEPNADVKLEYYCKEQNLLLRKAFDYLNQDLLSSANRLKRRLDKFQTCEDERYSKHCKILASFLNFGDDFVENVNKIKEIEIPAKPIRKKDGNIEDDNCLKSLQEDVKRFRNRFDRYNFTNKNLLSKQKSGVLNLALYHLYKLYRQNYSQLKKELDVIDFADVENMAKQLMQDNDILVALQQSYDYIFMDEYQDTNFLQEALVKPLAKDGHFIAVGDPKQGIYGFRNATMEIIQKDSREFPQQNDGGVEYLRGNFRSDERILNFINSVFEPVMTEESVGIDYKKTSKLESFNKFKKADLPAVRIDIIEDDSSEKERPVGIYSVKKDSLYFEKEGLETETIVARIDELLMQNIFDEKSKEFRRVQYDDIVVLFRSRGKSMETLANALSSRGFPVVSDVKNLDVEEPQVQMLLNLLRLLISKNNDNALISVMSSGLGDFSYDELSSMRLESPEESFYEISKSSDKAKRFFDEIDALKLEVCAKGLKRALTNFLVSYNYFAYIKSQKAGRDKLNHVYGFLQQLDDFNCDIAAAINYFDSVGGKTRGGGTDGGAIRLITIHASKGLEFPIVILANSGNDISHVQTNNFAINSEFGLGTKVYDFDKNVTASTPLLEAIKMQNYRKDMIDEIMIFYVALTRAKNHLYIVGQRPDLNFDAFYDVLKAKNYLELIFYSLGENVLERTERQGSFVLNDVEFNFIKTSITPDIKKDNFVGGLISDENLEMLEKNEFVYKNQNFCTFNIKNSVTALNLENKEKVQNIGVKADSDFISLGNAYHEALKLVDFSKVASLSDLKSELNSKKHLFSEDYYELLNLDLLYKNIQIIKGLGSGRYYKEKQFVMLSKLNEINPLYSDDEILIQGICDLFILGDKNILIDYKFTQEKNPENILARYSMQLKLYSKAIEEGLGIKLDKKYILSLKNAQLIEFLG